MSRILIAEDAPRIAAFLTRGLRDSGFSTAVVSDGKGALELASSGEFDLMILDLGLPELNGFDVLHTLRERDVQLPVIIVTARDSVPDKVAGLEGGADDYLAKPFEFDELVARIRARLRGERGPEATTLVVGNAMLDLHSRTVTARGRRAVLSAREFALAELFFRHPGVVLGRDQILAYVWGSEHPGASNVVAVYVGYLRKKLGGERITSVRGVGYRLEKTSRAPSAGEVLVVEDEARIAEFVSTALRQDGYGVVAAEDGERGTFLAVTGDFDLVLLDIGLPGRSGMDVLDEIRRERPALPVIVLTGRDDDEVRRRCLAYPRTDLLVKPTAVEDLRKLVSLRLARR